MDGIILCRTNIRGFEAIAGKTVPAMLEMCGETFLERILNRFIAAGISKVYILSKNCEDSVRMEIARFRYKDRIELNYVCGKDRFDPDDQNDYIVCDAVACADIDINSYIGLNAAKEESNVFCDQNGSFVMTILHKNNVKKFDFTNAESVLSHYYGNIYRDTTAAKTVHCICGAADFLACQAKLLDKSGGVTKHTDSNFNGVTFISPVYVGKNVSIGSGAVIGPHTVVSDNVRIGDGSVVNGSFVGRNAVIGKNCSVDGAYLCPDSSLMSRVRVPQAAVIKDGICVRPNTNIAENVILDTRYADSFARCKKPLIFDDDGICSLFDGSADVSEYVRLGKAVGSSLDMGDRVVVGRSSDVKMDILMDAVCCGLRSAGVDAYCLGECLLPHLSFAVTNTDSKIGIFIGVDPNGDVRLVQTGGLPLVTRLEKEICYNFDRRSFRCTCLSDVGNTIDAAAEKYAYEHYLESVIPKSLKDICVNVRTNDPIAAHLADQLFHHSNDCKGKRIVFQLSSDITSANAYSEETGIVRWEQLCLLGCRILFDEKKPVSLPYSIPFAAEKLAKRFQGTLHRYNCIRIDESDTAARAAAALPEGTFVRDALMLCVIICRYMNDKQISLKQAIDDIEPVCCTQRYTIADAQAVLDLENAQAVGSEGYEVRDRNTIAYIRPGKNDDTLMIYAESAKIEFASAFCDDLIEKLRRYADQSRSE